MSKKRIRIVLAVGMILCSLIGCAKSAPAGEMVKNRESAGEGEEISELPVGSAYVENEEKNEQETFPTLSELQEAVKEELDDHYWPEISISEEEFKKKTGISRNMYIEFLAQEPETGADIDTMIIIRAREDYVGAIEQALEDYRNRLIEENRKYPQNLCKVEAARMETIENYICYVQLGADTSIVAGKGSDEIAAYCLEENERAVDVLEKAILR